MKPEEEVLQTIFLIIFALMTSTAAIAKVFPLDGSPLGKQSVSAYAQYRYIDQDWTESQLEQENYGDTFQMAGIEHLVFERPRDQFVLIRFDIENTTDQALDLTVLMTQNSISYVNFYYVHNKKVQDSYLAGMKVQGSRFFP